MNFSVTKVNTSKYVTISSFLHVYHLNSCSLLSDYSQFVNFRQAQCCEWTCMTCVAQISPAHSMKVCGPWIDLSVSLYYLQTKLTACVLFSSVGRKRKGWAKRRRRQSGTKSSLKTLPKEDDSDDACEKSFSVFVPRSQAPSAIKLIRLYSSRP